jgi:hypothetical protein
VIATLTMARPQTQIDFRIPHPLPIVDGDRAQLTELLTNLISNAIKYNDKPQKWVEISYLPISPSPHLPTSSLPTPHSLLPTPHSPLPQQFSF